MLAAKVKARALRANSGHFGRGFAIQYSNKFENKMIPIVDPADKANDIDTDVVASMVIRMIMQRPRAFKGAGLRLAKNEKSAMYAINAALSAEIGIAAHIKYDNIKILWIKIINHFFSFNFFKRINSIAVTRDRCAPETATKWARPAVLKLSYKSPEFKSIRCPHIIAANNCSACEVESSSVQSKFRIVSIR